MLACDDIKNQMKDELDSCMSWTDAVQKAKLANKSLVAQGWNYGQWDKRDRATNSDSYATYGACITQVLLDVITGEVQVERADLLMDIGDQMDAAVDVGQIQGGFVMALGYLLTEDFKWDEKSG